MNLKIFKKISVLVLILFWVFSGWPVFQVQSVSASTSYYDPISDVSTGWDCVGADCDTLGHYSSLDDGIRDGSAPDISDYISIMARPNITNEEHGINSIIEPNINYLRLYYYAETGNKAGININLNNNGTSQASFSLDQNSSADWRYIQWDNPTPGAVSGEFAITKLKGTKRLENGTVYAWYIEVDYTPIITVGTVGNQTSLMDVSSTDNYLGGAFTFSSNIDTAEITEIIVSETGTVNANSNLSNLSLYYETAETCTYNGDETLFGTAVSFDASENATISGSMTVGTSNICLYPVLDVGSGASDSETLELEITDPSTEVTTVGGEVAPATPVLISGTTTLQTSPVVSISLNPTEFDYGFMDLSEEKRATSVDPPGATGIVITNTGNVNVDLEIKGGDATGGTQTWTLGNIIGADQYVHEFSTDLSGFTSSLPLTNTYQSLVSNIGTSSSQSFDLKIKIPSSVTEKGTQMSTPVTIRATEAGI